MDSDIIVGCLVHVPFWTACYFCTGYLPALKVAASLVKMLVIAGVLEEANCLGLAKNNANCFAYLWSNGKPVKYIIVSCQLTISHPEALPWQVKSSGVTE